MSLNLPESAEKIIQRAKTDVSRAWAGSNPFLKNSAIAALIIGYGNRVYDFYLQLKEAIKQSFPDTAEDEFLERWGSIFGIDRLAATKSSGNIVATGTASTQIPSGTTYTTSDGILFDTTSTVTISDNSLTVSSITRSGTTATVTTDDDHELASNVSVTISGANEADYNGTYEIKVTETNEFTYDVENNPTSPASGTILADNTSISVPVESQEYQDSDNDINVNLELDTTVSLQSAISGVDTDANVDYNEVSGGTDQESDTDLRSRLLTRIQDPVAHFNDSDIVAKAKEVNGVTRVFVQDANSQIGSASVASITRSDQVATVTTDSAHGYDDGQVVTITGANESEYNVTDQAIIVGAADTVFYYAVTGSPTSPATGTIDSGSYLNLGQVRIMFMRDNDDDAIPSGSEVTDVKDELLTIMPANMIEDDMIVQAPVALQTSFTFSELTPNTTAMQTAVENNLSQFFSEETEVGVDITEEKYITAIQSTVDEDGNTIDSFSLSAPSGDIAIDYDEIGTLNTVSFP